jgi:SAM-dependent methyltransferase
MIKQLLESPAVYELSQFLWYRKGKQLEYVTRYAQARAGESVLDIGCGVGAVAAYFPDGVYHGFDSNKAYVEYANRKYGSRAAFTYGEVGMDVQVEKERYDLVMANGLLHHLNDREVMHLLKISHDALKPGGRLVTRDGCFEEGQSRFVRLLLERDRGKYVRTEQGYHQLIAQTFPRCRATIRRDMLRLPYSLVMFQCTK